MRCTRCQGFMMEDCFVDLEHDIGRVAAWRCLNCGEVVDTVIHRHRSLPFPELATSCSD